MIQLLIFSFIMMIISIIVFLVFSIKLKYKKLSYVILICLVINSIAFSITIIQIIIDNFKV